MTLSAGEGSALDPYLVLYDASFKVIGENDDNADLNSALSGARLAEPGIYWITAGRCCPQDNRGTVGTYELEVTREAENAYASLLRDEGDDLATKGDIPGAVAKFEEAMTLDPSLNIEPEARATATAAVAMVEQAASLARNGKIREAGARLTEAQTIAPELDSPGLLFGICLLQTFPDLADVAAPACAELVTRGAAIEPGSLVTGTIDSVASDPWKLEVTNGTRVTVTLSAGEGSALDPYLVLYDASFKVIGENDDNADLNSALSGARLAEPGIYWITAGRCCPYNDQGTVGAYVLRASIKEAE